MDPQPQEDSRKKRGGLVSKANDAANKLRSLYQWAQRARQIAQAAQAALAAIGSGAWVPFAIVGGVILIIVLIILIGGGGSFSGGVGSANNGIQPPGGGGGNGGILASCPVANGSITTGSYQADPVNGHCSDNYGACNHDSRRAKSIDVSNSSQAVLPMIEGKAAKWTLVNKVDLKLEDCSNPGPTGCGKEFVFVNYLAGGKNWTLFIGHIGFTGMMMGQAYDSGTIVGSSATDHFHFSIGRDIPNPETFPPGGTDTRPGWLAADLDTGMCAPPPATGGGYCSVGTGYCSVFYLQNFFTDPTVANKMSIICNRESGGDPNGFNDSCLRQGGTLDYSGGLFQINLLAHTISDRQGNFLDCPTAFKSSTTGGLVERNSDLPCIIVDQTLADRCKTALLDPDANIKKAVELYNSSGFSPWAAAGTCNVH